jgi:hypothetical protein
MKEIVYYKLTMETQNPSADDYWFFETKARAKDFMESKTEATKKDPEYYGEVTFEISKEVLLLE